MEVTTIELSVIDAPHINVVIPRAKPEESAFVRG